MVAAPFGFHAARVSAGITWTTGVGSDSAAAADPPANSNITKNTIIKSKLNTNDCDMGLETWGHWAVVGVVLWQSSALAPSIARAFCFWWLTEGRRWKRSMPKNARFERLVDLQNQCRHGPHKELVIPLGLQVGRFVKSLVSDLKITAPPAS